MQCFSPIRIRLPKSRLNRATGEFETHSLVPCGRCVACKERQRLGWLIRLVEEQKHSSSAWFITLSYAEEFVPYHIDSVHGFCYNFDKRGVQLFLKRLRKYDGSNNLRYFLVSEYGGSTYRPHYHMHLFNAVGTKEQVADNLRRAWPFGRVTIGDFNDARANYCAGHVQMRDDYPAGYERPWILASRRPGIGASGLSHIASKARRRDIARLYNLKGMYLSLPRYYQEKIWTKRQNDIRNQKLESEIKSHPHEFELRRRFIDKVNKRKKLRIFNSDI